MLDKELKPLLQRRLSIQVYNRRKGKDQNNKYIKNNVYVISDSVCKPFVELVTPLRVVLLLL